MFTYSPFQAKALLSAILSLIIFVGTATLAKEAQSATLSADLQSLVSQGNDINTQLSESRLIKTMHVLN